MNDKTQQSGEEQQVDGDELASAQASQEGGAAGVETAAEPAGSTTVEPTSDEQIAKLKDELLRAQAETQNTAKRLRAEIGRAEQRGIEAVLGGMLDIVDSLEQALDTKTDNHQAVIDGVAITLAKFRTMLGAHGIEAIEPEVGDRIDPHLHQAVTQEECTELPEHSIKRVVMKGYRHNLRILRPANVIVSSRPAAKDKPPAEESPPQKD